MLCYLDNAATSFPKPKGVYDEVYKCMSRYCGNPGRGSHSLSLAAAKKIFECRESVAELVGVKDPERIIFTYNATYAINMVIKGVLKKGDHVIISDIEHNAVLRPIFKLAKSGIITYDVFPSLAKEAKRSPTLICAKIATLLKPNTKMIICSHASNICSLTLPIKEIGEFCKKRAIFFLVDGAQSVGHYTINTDEMNISALCFPSHKGLYGPQGAGIIALGDGISLETLIEGGNGINSLEGDMPYISPERYEAGTLATPIIAGLCEGVRFINSLPKREVVEYEKYLFCKATSALSDIKEVHTYLPQHHGSVLLFNVNGVSPEKVSLYLNSQNICTRAGFHCAPLAHKTLGTENLGGIRLSFGMFNKPRDIDNLSKAILKIKKEL